MVKEATIDIKENKNLEKQYQKDLKTKQKGLIKKFSDNGYDVVHIGTDSQDITDKIKESDLALKKVLELDSVEKVRSYKVGEVYDVTLQIKGKPEIKGRGNAGTYDKAFKIAESEFPSRSIKGRIEIVKVTQTFKFPQPELEKIVKSTSPRPAVAGTEYKKTVDDMYNF